MYGDRVHVQIIIEVQRDFGSLRIRLGTKSVQSRETLQVHPHDYKRGTVYEPRSKPFERFPLSGTWPKAGK